MSSSTAAQRRRACPQEAGRDPLLSALRLLLPQELILRLLSCRSAGKPSAVASVSCAPSRHGSASAGSCRSSCTGGH